MERPKKARRVARDRRLTPEEAAKYGAIREKVDAELPGLVARHQARNETFDAALKELPAGVGVDPLSARTLDDLRWACRLQLDLIEEGQDGTEDDDERAIRRWLGKFGEPGPRGRTR